MPIFDYKCNACGHNEDELLVDPSKVGDPQLCPKCQAPMEKLFTTTRVGGFVTDTKKLPNGDLVSRTRPINNSATWDRNPTKRWK